MLEFVSFQKVTANLFICETLRLLAYLLGKIDECFALHCNKFKNNKYLLITTFLNEFNCV